MCAECGCDGAWHVNRAGDHGHDQPHDHGLGHPHGHHHDHRHAHAHHHARVASGARTVRLERDLLAKNDALALKNRASLEQRAVLALNIIGSPGAGKTSLLEATIRSLREEYSLAVVEGDQATRRDAERIENAGCQVVQINTGAGCHLDARMLERALPELGLTHGGLLFIENVGNLVCPALFDLGEDKRVVVMSVTEGEDKPLKYPHVFRSADLFVLTKVDLLPHLDFDADACVGMARSVNPKLREIRVSARTGQGLTAWFGWLRAHAAARTALVG